MVNISIRFENQINQIKRIFTHPKYKLTLRGPRNDLVLLELTEPLTLSSRLLPACLANEATENLYDTLLFTGVFGDVISAVFFESIDQQLISNDECNRWLGLFRQRWRVTQDELCVVTKPNLDDEWVYEPGIQGAPVQVVNNRNCMFTAVGLTSYSTSIANHTQLIVLSRITSYLGWIEEIVWGEEPSVETTAVPLSSSTSEIPTTQRSVDFIFPTD